MFRLICYHWHIACFVIQIEFCDIYILVHNIFNIQNCQTVSLEMPGVKQMTHTTKPPFQTPTKT